MQARFRRALPVLVPAIVLLIMVLAIFWPTWSPVPRARMAFKYDPLWSYWGDLQFQAHALAHGQLPLWNPFERMGYPAYADLQGGLFYPLSWPFIAISAAAGGAAWWAITVKILLHFWLAAGGAYASCRRRALPVAACYAAAVMFVLAYPNSHHTGSILVWSLAWAPWMLTAVDALFEKPTATRGALLGFTCAMSLLAGGPASFWYGALACALYGAWALWHHARPRDTRRAYLGAAARTIAIAVAVFLALALAQIMATAELVGQSVRAERDLAFITAGAMGAKELAGMFIPRLGPYLGWLGIIGMAVALGVKPTARRLVLMAIVVLGFCLALGDQGPFLGSAASALSPFTLFRRSHRYASIAAVAYPLLAAEGLAMLMTQELQRLKKPLIVLAIVGVTILGCGFVTQLSHPDKPAPLREGFALGLIACLVSAWVALELVRRRGGLRRAFAAAVPLLLLADIWLAREPSLRLGYIAPPELHADARVQGLPGLPLAQRIFDREVLSWRPGSRLGLRDLGGYEDDPLALRRSDAYLRQAINDPRLLAHANVRYVLTSGRKAVKGDPARFERVGHEKAVVAPAPAIYWVDAAQVAADAAAARQRLLALVPGQAAVLEQGSLPAAELARAQAGTPGAAVPGTLTRLEANELRGEVDAPADGVVVVSEAYYPHGWRATVDGQATPIVPVNGAMRGLLVGPGHHTIVMTFHAPRTMALLAVELAGLLLVAGLCIRAGRRRLVVQIRDRDGPAGDVDGGRGSPSVGAGARRLLHRSFAATRRPVEPPGARRGLGRCLVRGAARRRPARRGHGVLLGHLLHRRADRRPRASGAERHPAHHHGAAGAVRAHAVPRCPRARRGRPPAAR
jgi:hypothetical protein